LNYGFKESHAPQALMNSRIVCREFVASSPGLQILAESQIKVGERLKVTFGMTRGQTAS
jgi:hypothetical protein